MADFKHIFVPVDFADSSQAALEFGIELSLKFGAALTLVHVYDVPVYGYEGAALLATAEWLAPIEAGARRTLDTTLAGVRARVPGAKAVLRGGTPAREILAAIDELHPDLVVMETHGRQGLTRALLGSVAERVVRLSPVPVLTVPRHRPPKH